MSRVFTREDDYMWLHDIPPTLAALKNFLTKENGGITISEKSVQFDKTLNTDVYKMSDGFSYYVKNNQWVEFEP